MPPKHKRPQRASGVAAAKKLRVASVDDDNNGGGEEAKEQKHNEVQVEHKPYKSDATLLSLNDDCFFAIFNRLSLSDLCSIAQTCQRLHQVSSEYFMRRHKSKVLIIEEVSAAGDLIKGPSGEEYVDVFTTSIRNVTLGYQNASTWALERLTNFYKTNEMAPIKNLRLNRWTIGLEADRGRVIANMVTEVESFTLSNSNVVGDLHDCILQHLPKMNRLTLFTNEFMKEMSYQWMEKSYTNLRYFAWHSNEEVPIDYVRVFFQINSDISFFSLKSKSKITLQKLVEHNIRVNKLFFTVSDYLSDFADLQKLCVQQGTRLHLKFPHQADETLLPQNMAQFPQLAQYIDGSFFQYNEPVQTLNTFHNLKVLHLGFLTRVQILIEIQTLQEIYIHWRIRKNDFQSYRESMTLFASRLPNLKRIYMSYDSQKFEEFKFDEMDAARKQLAGACKLKIIFKLSDSYMGCLNDIQREYETIEIERFESEELKNPFMNHYRGCW